MESFFTEQEISKVKLLLGHAEFDTMFNAVPVACNRITDAWRYDRIITIIAALEVKDTQIENLLQKSFVQNVGEISLSYSKALSLTKKEASRLLNEMANILQLDVIYDKYKDSGSSHSVLSF